MKIKFHDGLSVFSGLIPGKLYRAVRTKSSAIDQLPVYLCRSLECVSLPPGTLLVFLSKEKMIDCVVEETNIPPNVFLFEDLKISMGAYLGNIGWALEEVNTNDV